MHPLPNLRKRHGVGRCSGRGRGDNGSEGDREGKKDSRHGRSNTFAEGRYFVNLHPQMTQMRQIGNDSICGHLRHLRIVTTMASAYTVADRQRRSPLILFECPVSGGIQDLDVVALVDPVTNSIHGLRHPIRRMTVDVFE
jgi:hypothetical protein